MTNIRNQTDPYAMMRDQFWTNRLLFHPIIIL